jgi:hypothetical protein
MLWVESAMHSICKSSSRGRRPARRAFRGATSQSVYFEKSWAGDSLVRERRRSMSLIHRLASYMHVPIAIKLENQISPDANTSRCILPQKCSRKLPNLRV